MVFKTAHIAGRERATLVRFEMLPSRYSPPLTTFFSRADWDLGRPPRKGTDAAREHFYRYTQRHCMLFPDRSPAEVVERLKLMFRYNALKVNGVVSGLYRIIARRFFINSGGSSLPVVVRSLGLSVVSHCSLFFGYHLSYAYHVCEGAASGNSARPIQNDSNARGLSWSFSKGVPG